MRVGELTAEDLSKKEHVLEMESGNYYYIEKQGDKLVAGSVCNWGIIPDIVIDYNPEISVDDNICNLYDAVREYDDAMYLKTCAICGKEVYKDELCLTHDCHGIPFRYVCPECYEKIMNEKGYDGEYYTSLDEYIEEEDYY